MSVLTEKSFDNKAVMNQHETLFHRHPANPILTGKAKRKFLYRLSRSR